jgi:hypothetical protein
MKSLLLPSRACGLVLASCVALLGVFASPSMVLAEGVCPNEAFRVGASASLPDCRAYEMVTPVYKKSGDVTGESGAFGSIVPTVSSDGQSLVIRSLASFAGTLGNTGFAGVPYLLDRSGSGWLAASMELPESQFLAYEPPNFRTLSFGTSVDGRSEALLARSVSGPSNSIDIYRVASDGSVLEVGPALPPSAPDGSPRRLSELARLGPVGVSADGSHVFFRLSSLRWPFDTTVGERKSLYEYASTGNTMPMLVGVNNKGELIGKCGTNLGGTEGPNSSGNGETIANHNAISADGATVFFTSYACEKPVNEVYARIDNGLVDAHTVAISEPTKEDCEQCNTTSGLANPLFEGASEDGSKVFFTTTQPLLGGDSSRNIYDYDFDVPAGQSRITRVSGGDSTVTNPVAGVVGEPVQISEDGSHVYFVATGVLTRTPNEYGQTAQGGAMNLYVFERDAGYPAGHVAFISVLSSADGSLWAKDIGFVPRPSGADTTPDGRFLVFASVADLTPDDTSSSVRQIFEYDSKTGSLVRVSIGQDGFKENGNTSVYPAFIPSPNYSYKNYEEAADPRAYWSHMAVSADGSYVFFSSHDALVPGAIEEHSHLEPGGSGKLQVYDNGPNVYEYHGGNVHLIAKASNTNNNGQVSELELVTSLIGTDVSGADVFFGTTERLVGQDVDTDGDIYDARIGGGFPAPVAASECSGDACQGVLGAAPVLLSPGSEFQAGGNPPLSGSQSLVRKVSKKKAKPKKGKRAKRKRAKKTGAARTIRMRSTGGRK